jgi:hypothetical protein
VEGIEFEKCQWCGEDGDVCQTQPCWEREQADAADEGDRRNDYMGDL